MQTHRPVRILVMAALAVSLALAGAGAASAQDDGTTSTTQLDLGGDETSTTTAAPVSTSTTQLGIGGDSEVMSGSTAGQAPAPPTRVDAGAGGTASDPSVPLTGAVLAGGLVIVVGAAALKMRRELRA